MIQLSRLVFLVAAAADGVADTAQIAERVSAEFGRGVSAANVEFLVEQKLRPAGIVAGRRDDGRELPRASAPLALNMRRPVLPPAAVRVIAALLRPLFAPVLVGAVLAWLVAVDVWIFLHHGLARGLHELAARPVLFLVVLGLLLVSTVFHEFGHAAACRYGGATPGAMGAGFYIAWPAFYTDVTDAYRLDRRGRVRTDLGGVYFNAVFILATAGAYFWTRFEPLLLVVVLEHVTILQQLAPWARLDGYYLLTDLTGVPDVLTRAKPVLASLVPGRAADARVQELKPWVRVVVTLYVLTLVPVLALIYALLLLRAPAFFAAASRTFAVELEHAVAAWRAREVAQLALAAADIVVILLPAIAIAILLAGLALRLAQLGLRLARRLELRRRLRLVPAFAAGAAVALVALAWWPREQLDAQRGRGAEAAALRRLPLAAARPVPPEPIRRSEARLVRPSPTTVSAPFVAPPPARPRATSAAAARAPQPDARAGAAAGAAPEAPGTVETVPAPTSSASAPGAAPAPADGPTPTATTTATTATTDATTTETSPTDTTPSETAPTSTAPTTTSSAPTTTTTPTTP